MNKKFFLFLCSFLILSIGGIYAQVGINTEQPNKLTEFEVTNLKNEANEVIPKGIMIPRMTEEERAKIDVTDPSTANSLMIYNIDEDCYNYYSKEAGEWQSLCGALGKAVVTFDCDDVEVRGTYIEGRELTGSNYLAITVNVTKAGTYTISGSTDNGYGFFVSGTFMATGIQTVMVPGQGIPVAVQTDIVTMNNNGVEVTCSGNPVTVDVLTAAGTFEILCGTAQVKGVYEVGKALNPMTNYIVLPITVTNGGSYEVVSNTVDGISFSGSGEVTTATTQIVLQGSGIPSSTTIKTITLTSNSAGGVSTTCNVDIRIVIPKKKILTCALASVFGYDIGDATSHAYKMLMSEKNFGKAEESVVACDRFEFSRLGYPTATQLRNEINRFKPDIIQIGFHWDISADAAQVLMEYLKAKGVVVMFSENGTGTRRFLTTLFSDPTITTTSLTPAGRSYKISWIDHEVLTGPFMDLRDLQWGDDGTNTLAISGLPYSDIDVISNGINLNAANPTGTNGQVTAFIHKTLNLIYIGDGGFTAGQSGTYGDSTWPETQVFSINNGTDAQPVANTGYGSNRTYTQTVYNSFLFGNIMSWAIKRSEFDGYNKK